MHVARPSISQFSFFFFAAEIVSHLLCACAGLGFLFVKMTNNCKVNHDVQRTFDAFCMVCLQKPEGALLFLIGDFVVDV